MRPLHIVDVARTDKHRRQPIFHVKIDRLKEVQKSSRAIRCPGLPLSRRELQGLYRERNQVFKPKRLEVSYCQRPQHPAF